MGSRFLDEVTEIAIEVCYEILVEILPKEMGYVSSAS